MIRVTSKEPHKSAIKEIICKKCGSVLEYVLADVKSKKVSDYLGDTETVHYIECPSCNNHISVNSY